MVYLSLSGGLAVWVTIYKNVGADLGSKGQTKDLSKGRHLSGLYNKKSGLKKELV